MLYTVSEIAKQMGLNASTIRYYDQEGLLPYVERSSNGMRMFSKKDIEWLKVIECLKKSGLSIKEIQSYVQMVQDGRSTLEKRYDLFLARHEAIMAQIQDLIETKSLLEYKCWYYKKAIELGDESSVKDLPLKLVPKEFQKYHPSRNL